MSDTALLVIDAQESFRHRPYWSTEDFPQFVDNLQRLIDGVAAQGVPIVQVFHNDPTGPFSKESGFVTALPKLSIAPDAVFHKTVHSALVGSGLNGWLTARHIRRLILSGIRTEQCCETTARYASDAGYVVDFVTEATLTFAMTDRHGRVWDSAEIKARTELVLEDRFARIVTVDEAIAGLRAEIAA